MLVAKCLITVIAAMMTGCLAQNETTTTTMPMFTTLLPDNNNSTLTILESIFNDLDRTTVAAYLAAAMSTMTFAIVFIGFWVWFFAWCIKRKKENSTTDGNYGDF